MKETVLQSTKRELQAAARSPLLWAALAAAALVLGLAGPFGTYEALALPGRLAYWSFVAVVTYFTGFLVVTALNASLPGHRTPLRDGVFGAISGLPIAILVWLLNQWIFPDGGLGFLPLLAYVVVVSAAACFVIALFAHNFRTGEAASAPTATPPVEPTVLPERPPLLDRLAPALHGKLQYLSMQDHYVEVVTDKGSQLVLMRMSDAIAETGGIDGLQVHRSHWVARAAVTGSGRRGERVVLRLVNGAEVPVSRSKLRDVRAAGLL